MRKKYLIICGLFHVFLLISVLSKKTEYQAIPINEIVYPTFDEVKLQDNLQYAIMRYVIIFILIYAVIVIAVIYSCSDFSIKKKFLSLIARSQNEEEQENYQWKCCWRYDQGAHFILHRLQDGYFDRDIADFIYYDLRYLNDSDDDHFIENIKGNIDQFQYFFNLIKTFLQHITIDLLLQLPDNGNNILSQAKRTAKNCLQPNSNSHYSLYSLKLNRRQMDNIVPANDYEKNLYLKYSNSSCLDLFKTVLKKDKITYYDESNNNNHDRIFFFGQNFTLYKAFVNFRQALKECLQNDLQKYQSIIDAIHENETAMDDFLGIGDK